MSIFENNTNNTNQNSQLIKNTQLYIGGQFVESKNKGQISIINPCNEQEICKISEATEIDVKTAVELAQQSHTTIKNIEPKDRSLLLLKIAENIEKHQQEYIQLEMLNTGRTLQSIEFDFRQIIEVFRFYAGKCDKLTGQNFTNQPNQLQYTKFQPLGIIGLITSWNQQFLTSVKLIAPAIAAGNSIVHKASEVSPLCLLRFCQTLSEVGVPGGIYNLVTGYGPTAGKALSTNKNIKLLYYCGSQDTGKLVLQNSINELINVKASFNGKSPIIIGPDADPVNCANLAWACATYNNGFSSVSGSKLLIHEQVYHKIIGNLKNISQNNVVLGDPLDTNQKANHGPLINKSQQEKCKKFVEMATQDNKCQVLNNVSNLQIPSQGYYFPPTILIDMPDQSSDEIMGPILSILKPWKTSDEVIQRCNSMNFGESVVIMSQDQGFISKCVSQIQAGNIFVDCWMNPQIYIPFNSQKQSGYNNTQGGENLIYEFCNQKAVYMHINEQKFL